MDEQKICEIVGRLYLENLSLKDALGQQKKQLDEQQGLIISLQTAGIKHGPSLISNP